MLLLLNSIFFCGFSKQSLMILMCDYPGRYVGSMNWHSLSWRWLPRTWPLRNNSERNLPPGSVSTRANDIRDYSTNITPFTSRTRDFPAVQITQKWNRFHHLHSLILVLFQTHILEFPFLESVSLTVYPNSDKKQNLLFSRQFKRVHLPQNVLCSPQRICLLAIHHINIERQKRQWF